MHFDIQPSLPPAAGGRTEIIDEGTYDMVKDRVFNHTVSIHLYIQKGRVGGLARSGTGAPWSTLRGSVTLDDDTGASQAEPDQGNKVERYSSRHRKVQTPIGVFKSWRGRGKGGRCLQGKLGSQVKIAWSKRRFGDLEFFRIWGEHEVQMC